MTTIQENRELPDTEEAKSDKTSVESGSPDASDDQPVGLDQAETDPVGSDQADIEQLGTDPVSDAPVKSDQDDIEPAYLEPVSSELNDDQLPAITKIISPHADGSAHPQPVSSEVADLQQVDTETVPDSANDIEQVNSGHVDEEHIHSEDVNLEQPNPEGEPMNMGMHHDGQQPSDMEFTFPHSDVPELAVSQPMSSELIHSQPISSEVAALEQIDTETVPDSANVIEQVNSGHVDEEHIHTEDVSSEQFNPEAEPMNMDMHHDDQQPSGMEFSFSHSDVPELVVSQPMSSEIIHSQPDGSEDLVGLQSYDHETHPHMYTDETPHGRTEFVKSEHVLPDHMHTEALGSDLEQQVGSELMHQLEIGPELVDMQPIGSDIVHSESPGQEVENMQLVPTDMVDSELVVEPEPTPPTKGRKKKSIVWEHFTIETVSPGCRRACCKVCKQSFAYSTGSKVAGTSHLKRHIAKGTCPLSLKLQEGGQLTPYTPKNAKPEPDSAGTTGTRKRRYRASNTQYNLFDQDQCRHEIARMIIMHEYPLNMVEHPGLVSFVQHLQPRFDMVNFSTAQGDCVAVYLREKQKLQKLIDGMPGHICLTVDVWTSTQTTGYVFLHGQFINHEWRLQKRLLNVVMEPFPESDSALSHAVGTCLSYWNLDGRLCSITFNQHVNDSARANLRGLLCFKKPSILNGQLLVGSCLARTLSDMALDALASGHNALTKIRSSVKYVKTSDSHEDKFLELKQQLQVPSQKTLVLDSVTQWDTTYQMLAAACELKEVFSCLDASDPEYKDAPTMEDWKQAENVSMYLKLFFETANFLISRNPPSTNVFFHEVWKIQLELARDAASEDPFVRNIAISLQNKFNKYWKDTFIILAIAVSMDPRFKMKLVEFSFSKLFSEEAPSYIKMVEDSIHDLFHEYTEEGLKPGENQPMASNGLSDFDMYIMETTSQQAKSELDQYLGESLLPRVNDFDVLGWWKLNKVKYPVLTKMARDILSIPISSVGPDYVFNTVGKEMDENRSLLKPETMEALTCAKDWLQYDRVEALNGLLRNDSHLNG